MDASLAIPERVLWKISCEMKAVLGSMYPCSLSSQSLKGGITIDIMVLLIVQACHTKAEYEEYGSSICRTNPVFKGMYWVVKLEGVECNAALFSCLFILAESAALHCLPGLVLDLRRQRWDWDVAGHLMGKLCSNGEVESCCRGHLWPNTNWIIFHNRCKQCYLCSYQCEMLMFFQQTS